MAADSPAAHSPAHTAADNLADRMVADIPADRMAADIPADHRAAADNPHTPADHIAAAHSRFAARSPDHRHHWARSRHSGHSPAPADNCPAKTGLLRILSGVPGAIIGWTAVAHPASFPFFRAIVREVPCRALCGGHFVPPARGLSRKRLNRALHDNASYSIAQKNGL